MGRHLSNEVRLVMFFARGTYLVVARCRRRMEALFPGPFAHALVLTLSYRGRAIRFSFCPLACSGTVKGEAGRRARVR